MRDSGGGDLGLGGDEKGAAARSLWALSPQTWGWWHGALLPSRKGSIAKQGTQGLTGSRRLRSSESEDALHEEPSGRCLQGWYPRDLRGPLSMREPHNKHRCSGDTCGFYSASGTSFFVLIFTKF